MFFVKLLHPIHSKEKFILEYIMRQDYLQSGQKRSAPLPILIFPTIFCNEEICNYDSKDLGEGSRKPDAVIANDSGQNEQAAKLKYQRSCQRQNAGYQTLFNAAKKDAAKMLKPQIRKEIL